MGLFKTIAKFARRRSSSVHNNQFKKSVSRRCQFEEMEPRRVLSADPVIAGITYLEGDIGQDVSPDYFEVTFQGGSNTTMLSQFTINGDQDLNGVISDGDMFFDVNGSAPGAGGFAPFQFDAANSIGIEAGDVRGVSVSDDGLLLTIEVDNFEEGDVFAFSLDVDEQERLKVDKIASGVEFESSLFTATFVDAHYSFTALDVSVDATLEGGVIQNQQQGLFYDEYNELLDEASRISGDQLDLNYDNQLGQADRTAAAIDAYELQPKPVVISGHVYHDENLNCLHDPNEDGIQNVNIELQRMNANGVYQTVATTQTDANGFYEFGEDLGLQPGTFRLIQSQPDGYLDVGASAGTVEGQVSGLVGDDAAGDANVISNIQIPLGNNAATNYDFKEVRPATIEGHVWHDRNDDGQMDPGEEGIANVLIRVSRVGAKGNLAVDPFATFDPVFVRTDANGHYSVDALPPGIYEIVEINNYPDDANPLDGFMDGKDSLGAVNGVAVGNQSNDRFSQVELCADDAGVEFNFGELKPASISGFVSVTSPDGSCLDPNDPAHQGIAGVTIELYGQNGLLLASTQTDANGFYEFADLAPGTYTILEVQPAGYLDAGDSLGMVDGVVAGRRLSNDGFTRIELTSDSQGTMYNFCEHLPAELSGRVWHDANDNGILEQGEDRIENVLIELYDENGNLVATERTDSDGRYHFENLLAGTYKIQQIQPVEFVDGKESLGSVVGSNASEALVGSVGQDMFTQIELRGGDSGVRYDFGEILYGSLSGTVHADRNGDCVFEASQGDMPLADVTLVLLDANGNEVARTVTDQNGDYSFNQLRPGEYTVRQAQPDGYLDGEATAGTVLGTTVGSTFTNAIRSIVLTSGQNGVNYDFCEHVPAELCGTVYHDRNNNGMQDAGEEGIGGTVIQLFDANGNLLAEQVTDADGRYCFADLVAGEYKLREMQPTAYIDGLDSVGSISGVTNGMQDKNDEFCMIQLLGGDSGNEYNFGELKLASLSGYVHTDPNGDCLFDRTTGDSPLANVMLELLNSDGEVIATTTTNANGFYEFQDLIPGEYSVRQQQPDGLFDAGARVGNLANGADGLGNADTINEITGIKIESGQRLVQYNFCENEPAEIHGRVWEDGPAFQTQDGTVPLNYRDLRDGVFQAGTDSPLAGVRMYLYYYIDPATVDPITGNGVVAPRAVTLSEVLPGHYDHLGNNPQTPLWVETDAQGRYSFTGLEAGSYIVLEQQPEGYVDANDTPGTTQGFTFNSANEASLAPEAVLRTFSATQVLDSVVNIQLTAGGVSLQNNFSEVRAESATDAIVTNPPRFNVPGNPQSPSPGITGFPGTSRGATGCIYHGSGDRSTECVRGAVVR